MLIGWNVVTLVSEAVHLFPAPVSPCGTEWCYADMHAQLDVNVVIAKQFWKIKMGKIGQKREYHVVPDSSAQEVVSLGASSGQSEEGLLWFENVYFYNSIPSSTFLQKQKTWGLGRISIITTFTQEGNELCTESIFLVLEITLTNSILQSTDYKSSCWVQEQALCVTRCVCFKHC